MKDETWGGVFVDLGADQDIEDRAVLKVVIQQTQVPIPLRVASSHATSLPICLASCSSVTNRVCHYYVASVECKCI